MTTKDVLYYLLLFLSVAFFIYKSSIFKKSKYVFPLGYIVLFAVSCCISFLYSYATIQYFKGDILLFFRDANNISCYLEQDFFKNIELLLWYGGKIDPPRIHDQVMGTNTWSIPSDFLMSRIYGFFMYISRENLYVISLFFGFISFSSKYLWIQIAEKYNLSKEQTYLLLFMIIFSGIDSFFIQGMHKESITFLLLSYLFYFQKSEKNLLSISLFLLSIIHLIILRNYIVAIFIIALVIWELRKAYVSNKNRFYTFLTTSIVTTIILIIKIAPFLIQRKERFNKKAIGNTALDFIDFNNSFLDNSIIFIKSIFRLFFYIPNSNFLSPINLTFFISNLIFLFWIIFFILKRKTQHINFYFFTFLPAILGLILIITIVPNYGSIVRYRSVFVILIYIGIVFNTKRVNIFSIYYLLKHFIKNLLFLQHKN